MYTNVHVAEKFGISREAARQWANQFSKYLSPSANPETGRQRNYDDDDLEVFSLIASMKAQGAKLDEIFAALESGQRGSVPTDSQIVPRSDAGISVVRRQLAETQIELEVTQSALLKSEGKVELLQQQLADKERTIRDLYRELARLEAAQGDE